MRICAVDGCDTPLASINKADRCFVHRGLYLARKPQQVPKAPVLPPYRNPRDDRTERRRAIRVPSFLDGGFGEEALDARDLEALRSGEWLRGRRSA